MDMENVGQLTWAIETISQLNQELIDATAAGDVDQAAMLLEQIVRMEERRNKLVHQRYGAVRPTRYETVLPLRDKVIKALHLGGRPMATKLLADVAQAYFGERIPTQALSSLRRDERRRFDASRGSRTTDQYVVSALTFDTLTPVRGAIALSSWPLKDRVIGPSSPRVDLLKIAVALAKNADRATDQTAANRLLLRLARTIPDAIEAARPTTALSVDLGRLEAAAEAELQQIADRDADDRAEAAGRAAALSPGEALFGVIPAPRTGAVREAR